MPAGTKSGDGRAARGKCLPPCVSANSRETLRRMTQAQASIMLGLCGRGSIRAAADRLRPTEGTTPRLLGIKTFLYRRPSTSLRVQGWAPDHESERAEDVFEGVTCLAWDRYISSIRGQARRPAKATNVLAPAKSPATAPINAHRLVRFAVMAAAACTASSPRWAR